MAAALCLVGVSEGQAQAPGELETLSGFKERLGDIEKNTSAVKDVRVDESSLTLKSVQKALKGKLDPQSLFFYVRDNIGFEPYEGHLRDTRSVLMTRAGNSLDQSLFLKSLLDKMGHKSRIAYGDLDPLSLERLMVSYLGRAKLDQAKALSGSSETARRFRQVASRCYWVEVYVERKWVAMAPMFTSGVYGVPPAQKKSHFEGVPPEAEVLVTFRVHARMKGGKEVSLLKLSAPLEDVTYRNLRLKFATNSRGDHLPMVTISGETREGTAVDMGEVERLWVEFFFDRGGRVQKREIRSLYTKGGSLNLFDSDLQVFSLLIMPGWMNETFLKAVAIREMEMLQRKSEGMERAMKEWVMRTLQRREVDVKLDAYVGDLLGSAGGLMALTYATMADRVTVELALRFGVRVYVDEPRVFITGGVRRGPELYWHLDLRQDEVKAFPAVGLPEVMVHAFQTMRGGFTSELESSVVSQLAGRPLITASAVLGQVAKRNMEMTTILPSEVDVVVEGLKISEAARKNLMAFVRTTGNVAVLPSRPMKVNGEPVNVWLGIDPNSAKPTGVREDGAFGGFSKGEVSSVEKKAPREGAQLALFGEALTQFQSLSRTVALLVRGQPDVCAAVCKARKMLTVLPALPCSEGALKRFDVSSEVQQCLSPKRERDDLIGLGATCEELVAPFRCGAALATLVMSKDGRMTYSETPEGHTVGPWSVDAVKVMKASTCACQ